MRKTALLVLSLCLSLSVFAGRPKIGPGLNPGIDDGEGNATGGGNNTEVTLPVGLPASGDDPAAATEPAGTSNIVYAFDLNDDNGASSVNQAHSAFENARNMNAACVLIRINSFAGGWDAAENIRQEIIDYDRPVMVYVNNQTIPAAQFISSGADSIYTKKGSTLSNKNAVAKSKASSDVNRHVNGTTQVAATSGITNSSSQENFSDDVTMNEILYKAGLGNLTVVEHNPGISERAVDFLMHPAVVLVVLLLIGFIMRRTSQAKLPGPMLYLLAFVTMLYLAPFQVSGLANSMEILSCLTLIITVIAASRYEKRWLAGICLLLLTFAFTLVRAGDTEAILQYGSFSDLLTLPSIPMGLVILGWWLGKFGARATVRKTSGNSATQQELIAA